MEIDSLFVMMVIGSLRDRRFVVYSGSERLGMAAEPASQQSSSKVVQVNEGKPGR